jgi:hypothetical protein
MASSSFRMLTRHVHVQPRERVERLAQQAEARSAAHAQLRRRHVAGRAAFDDGLDHARDLVGLVAGTLQVGRGLGDGDQQAQVARRGLAPAMMDDSSRSISTSIAVDAGFHVGDLAGRLGAELCQRIDGGADLRLDQAAHFHDAGGHAGEFAVELAGEVFVCHVSRTFP